MSRRAVQLLLEFPEKLRFVRGLRAWLGLSGKAYPVARSARAAGDPQYSLGKLLKLALWVSLPSPPGRCVLVSFAER